MPLFFHKFKVDIGRLQCYNVSHINGFIRKME